MRSFIKSHKKNESATSDLFEGELDNPLASNLSKTPAPSPIIHQSLQFTPPQISSTSISSPKKLLTPIRNLFSSSNNHQKNSISVPLSSDNLNNAIFTKNKFKPNKRGGKSVTSLSHSSANTWKPIQAVKQYEWGPDNYSGRSKVNSSSELASISKNNQSLNEQTESREDSPDKLKPAWSDPYLDDEITTSIPKSLIFELDQKSFEEGQSDYESDASSQFSFVRDKRGGRNTSVKYYKTLKAPETHKAKFSRKELISNEEGFEDGDLTDYDFENNGIEEYDYEFTDQEEIHYNNLFDDENEENDRYNEQFDCNQEESINSAAFAGVRDLAILAGEVPKHNNLYSVKIRSFETNGGRIPFYKSYHASIEGFEDPGDQNNKSDTCEEDLLENYLDLDENLKSKSIDGLKHTPTLSQFDNLDLFDLHSPLINGLTIGNNLKHRSEIFNSIKKFDETSYNNELFIHRGPSIDVTSSEIFDLKCETQILDCKEAFRRRIIKSFHSSLSDDIDFKVLEKVEAFENFSSNFESDSSKIQNSNYENVGLGISDNLDESEDELSEIVTPVKNIGIGNKNLIEKGSISGDAFTKNETSDINGSIQTNRQSVTDMLNALSNLEVNDNLDRKNKENDIENRKSVNEMMATLISLEGLSGQVKNTKRDSIKEMLETLSNLEYHNMNVEEKEEKESNNLSNLEAHNAQDTNRYSWYNDDESIAFKTANTISNTNSKPQNQSKLRYNFSSTQSDSEDLDYEQINTKLDEELIEEINRLPTDFDFEDYIRSSSSVHSKDSYYRSNSYLKKPIRAIMENKYSSNKIETLNKTVTFYRSNSCNSYEAIRTRSLSRAPSVRSINSFSEVNEEEEFNFNESDRMTRQCQDHSKRNVSIRSKECSYDIIRDIEDFQSNSKKLNIGSMDSLTKRSSNLDSISETEKN